MPRGAFSIEIVDTRPGLCVLRVLGPKAWDYFKDEPGGHRFQRVSPTEKRGRVQTSTITVVVLPEPKPAEIILNDRDLEITACRGSGAGGQHRNVTASAVQIKHIPTGIQVRCEAERSQFQNKETALALLKAKLWEIQRNGAFQERVEERKRQAGSGMRGDKRRTIRVQDDHVVDHPTGRTWQYKKYIRGDW